MKHRDSSTRQDGVPNDKRRKTNIRPAGICEAKIKVTWSISSKMVRIERFKDSPDHTHTLSESDMNKCSSTICTLVSNEAVKNYTPVAITSVVREFAKNDLELNDRLNI